MACLSSMVTGCAGDPSGAVLISKKLKYLPEDTSNQILGALGQALAPIQALDQFDIRTSDPVTQQRNCISSVKKFADALYKAASPWIPYLAYQEGHVAENISQLTKAVGEGRRIVSQAKEAIEADKAEMAEIIRAAREASAAAGAAVFTKDFADESTAQLAKAESWLIASGLFAVGAAIVKPEA